VVLVLVCVAWLPPARQVAATQWDALLHRREAREQARRYGIDPDLARAIAHAARSEGIDPELGFRLVRVESGFRERAVSPVGALGLTQLMPRTAAELQPGITREQTFERDTNLRLGFRYLRWLLQMYDGDIEEALHAYNRGPGTVRRVRAAGRNPANGYASFRPSPAFNAGRRFPAGPGYAMCYISV
jgi:soluble lytic murein transglycosylase-like protein